MIIKFTHIIPWMLVFLLAIDNGWTQGFNPGFEKKHDYPVRAFLNKFSVNLSSGYGRTFYRHTLEEYSYLRNDKGSYILPGNSVTSNTSVAGYRNWFSDVNPANIHIPDSPSSESGGYSFLPASDTSHILMKSGGYTIPVHLSVYFNLFRLRLGGGAGLDFHNASIPEPENFMSRHPAPESINSLMFRYYFLLGYSIYEIYDNAFGVDVRFGRINMGRGFNREVIKPGGFVNIGITLEKVFSEYFRIYARPAYEIKSFSVNMPSGNAMTHQANAFLLTLGVSINYPDLPRSPIKNDKIQMRHYISDPKGNRREFRGQPFWRKQDPKIGELYPELIKTKRKRQAKRKEFFRKKN